MSQVTPAEVMEAEMLVAEWLAWCFSRDWLGVDDENDPRLIEHWDGETDAGWHAAMRDCSPPETVLGWAGWLSYIAPRGS